MSQFRSQKSAAARRAMLLAATMAVATSLCSANTTKTAGTDLANPANYSPTGLPTQTDDVRLPGTSNSFPARLDGNTQLTVGSLDTLSTAFVINGTAGVSGFTLGGPLTTSNTTPGANAKDILFASAPMTIVGATANADGSVGFLDMTLGRDGRFDAVGSSSLTVQISSAIDTAGHLITFTGSGLQEIGQAATSPQTSSSSIPYYDSYSLGGIRGSGGISVFAGARVQLDGTHTYTGTTVVQTGALLTLAGSINNSASIINGGTLNLADRQTVLAGNPAAPSAVTPVISGGGTLNQAGTATVTLNSANTYTGVTRISSGALSVSTLANGGTASGIGASTNAAANLVIGSATLSYTGTGASTDRLFTSATPYTPSATPQPPASLKTQIDSSGTGPLTFTNTGAIAFDTSNLAAAVTIGGSNTDLNVFAPQITNSGTTAIAFAKTGSGTWRLTGNNTFSGGAFVYGGTLLAPGTGALGSGTVYIGPAGAVGLDFAINNNQLTPGKFSGTGTVLLGGSNTETFPMSFATNANSANLVLGVQAGRTQTYTGTITPANNTYRLGGGGGTLILNSALVDAATNAAVRSLVIGVPLQQTTGTTPTDIPYSSTPAGSRVVLNGANTFTGGTTVNSGIVEMGSSGALGTGSIKLANQGTVVPFGAVDQAFVSRINNTSVGSIALTGDQSNNLDFTTAGQTMLGASGNASYSGTLTPTGNAYRLGGGGGTLTFNSPLLSSAASQLFVSGNGLPSSTVVLNNSSSVGTVSVYESTLKLGANGTLTPTSSVTLSGQATLDFGGKNVTLNSLMFWPNSKPAVDVSIRNGQLTLTSGIVGDSSSSNVLMEKHSIDFSGLDKLSFQNSANGFAIYTRSGAQSTVRLAQNNVILTPNLSLGSSNGGALTGDTNVLFEFGHTNDVMANIVDLGSQAGPSLHNLIRFPATGAPNSLKLRGTVQGKAASQILVHGYSDTDTTLDWSNGTVDVAANLMYVGRHGSSFGQKTTFRLGGDASILNVGRLYVGQAQAGVESINSLPNSVFLGVSDDRVEQQAGTALAGSVYLNTSSAATNTMLGTYTLGTATSSATLSAYQIQIGGPNQAATLSAKSRATIDFVNGRLEAFDVSHAPADSPSTITGQPSTSETASIIRGLPGGGAANDFRTLTINLAATGTHTFAAAAGKSLTVDTTALITGAGGLTVEGPGMINFNGANSYAGLTTVKQTFLTLSPAAQTVILTGGGADIQSGRLVLSGATNPAAQLAQVRSLLAAGYATSFNAGQFRSTTLTAGRGLGYTVDQQHTIQILPALYGDADLNGAVDFNDFLSLQNSFNTDGGWTGGDFNYDGTVDFNDFLALQNNFGSSFNGAAVAVTANQRAALATFAATVPEPGLMAVAALGMAALVRRRRSA